MSLATFRPHAPSSPDAGELRISPAPSFAAWAHAWPPQSPDDVLRNITGLWKEARGVATVHTVCGSLAALWACLHVARSADIISREHRRLSREKPQRNTADVVFSVQVWADSHLVNLDEYLKHSGWTYFGRTLVL